ncbi:MAG: excinuclease ABC subunit A [Verrucomicrobia bacterium]|nr:excinuclease ABC subunit A [Verrucomicrobiota bacterium]
MSRPGDFLRLRGARQHNLAGIDLDIPRHRLVVLTGPSGSGKSSLAFDTIYAEGQRRYLESLSAHARLHLESLPAAAIDSIEGLSPTLAVEQRHSGASSRSTLATSTEIHDHLRILFSTNGTPHDPQSGRPLLAHSPQQIVDEILQSASGKSVILLAPVTAPDPARLKKEGFLRARVKNRFPDLADISNPADPLELVIDRIQITESGRSRLSDSVDLALRLGQGKLSVAFTGADFSENLSKKDLQFSTEPEDRETGLRAPRLTPRHFSFNSPEGACSGCSGLGHRLSPDPEKILPNPLLSLERGAIAPWNRAHPRIRSYYRTLGRELARHLGLSPTTPLSEWPASARSFFLKGSEGRPIIWQTIRGGRLVREKKPFEGIIAELDHQMTTLRSESARNRLRRFFSPGICPSCLGLRLNPNALAVTLGGPPGIGHNLATLCRLSVSRAKEWLVSLPLPPGPSSHAFPPLRQAILQRLAFLEQLGLGYLTLDRPMDTLSGGEARRARLATQVGGGLTGVLYVLDEPSIGLHPSDHSRLLDLLFSLRDLGNSLLVVEHDEETLRRADHLIEFGPGSGSEGGRVVAQGTPAQIAENRESLTGAFLSGRRKLSFPKRNFQPMGWLRLKGASAHNLKKVDAEIPLGSLTCVTGVSGSGKSTLIFDTLSPALLRHYGGPNAAPIPGAFSSLEGAELLSQALVIDQTPLPRLSRSNPLTLLGVFDDLRQIFAALPASKARGFGPSRFSFNLRGGRCETCAGHGEITIQLQLLPEAVSPCPACEGRRYNRETLAVTYRGHSIAAILNLSVDRALNLLRAIPTLAAALEALQRVGLGYLPIGQPADRLSGGEAQRVRLAAALARRTRGPSLYLLDEPTTGLHLAEVERLLSVFFALCEAGHTLVVVEHHPDIIRHADHILDMGPGGGESGGRLVASGTPAEVARNPESLTGQILAQR